MPKHFVPFSFLLLLCACGSAAQDPLPLESNAMIVVPQPAPAVKSNPVIEAPQPRPAPPHAGFFTFRGYRDPALRSNREAFHDKAWAAAQAVWLGSIVYDAEVTHQGIAHHKCVEGNGDLSERPTRGALYLGNLAEYAAGTGFNYLALRFIGKPLIFEFAGYGSVQHFRSGSAWLTNCWWRPA